MNYLIFYIFLAFPFQQNIIFAETQNDTIKITTAADLIALDVQNNIYAVDQEQRITKYSSFGKKVNFYQNNRLGKIQQFDVANPHKILVFYQDQQTIIFLDRNMLEVSRIELNRFGLPEISTAAVSNDNQTWIFDEFKNNLKKLDGQGNTRTLSESTIGLWGESLNPSKIRERFNRVFLLDMEKGIFIFDNVGNAIGRIDLKGVTDFSVINNNTLILNHSENRISFYRLSDGLFSEVEWPENLSNFDIIQMRMANNNILLSTKDELIFLRN